MENCKVAAETQDGLGRMIEPSWANCGEQCGERQEQSSMHREIQFEEQQGMKGFKCATCDEENCTRGTIQTMNKHLCMTQRELGDDQYWLAD